MIHELFEKQVEQTPEKAALFFEHSQLTYRELNEQANRLAHRLIKSGVAAETPVAILMERSPEMVAGISKPTATFRALLFRAVLSVAAPRPRDAR